MSTLEAPIRMDACGRLSHWGDITVIRAMAIGILFAAAFFNLVSLNSDKDIVELDSQVVLKLAIIAAGGLYGAWSFASDSRVRAAALSFPAAWIPVLFGFYFVSSLYSSEPKNAFVSTTSILCIYLLTIAGLVQVGKAVVLNTLFFATALFVAGSWLVFFFLPEIGVLQEPVGDGEFASRMAGLAHPNTLGQFSALSVILGSVLYLTYRRRGTLRILLIVLAAGALVCSMSRTATMATIIALLIACRHHLIGPNFVQRGMIAAGLLVVALMFASTEVDFGRVVQNQIQAFSKSGDAEEIMSATGRGEIWARTIQLIRERPVLGYGAASSKTLLEDYSLYTHNMLLNIALCSGVFGGLVGLMMCGSRIRMLFCRSHPMADALVVFVMINGLSENTIFSNLSGLPTIVWTIGLVWFNIKTDEIDGELDD